jgi:hypothetical protein
LVSKWGRGFSPVRHDRRYESSAVMPHAGICGGGTGNRNSYSDQYGAQNCWFRVWHTFLILRILEHPQDMVFHITGMPESADVRPGAACARHFRCAGRGPSVARRSGTPV